MSSLRHRMSPQQVAWAAQIACLLEVSAPKPGNVSGDTAFEDLNWVDFLLSAVAIGPAVEMAASVPVGEAILQAVKDTQSLVNTNTNLGIVLLLIPLAKAYYRAGQNLREELRAVLEGLTVEDARQAYAAIRMAQAGGLGQVEEQDVSHEPTLSLRQAMALATERDNIAREYCTGYATTFEIGLPALMTARESGADILSAIVQTFITLLAQLPDTLIQRKRTAEVARWVSHRAQQVLDLGGVMTEVGQAALRQLDEELRDPSHALNPGTTADLTAAVVFLALLEEGLAFLGR